MIDSAARYRLPLRQAVEQYPLLTTWILGGEAWIELGQNDFSDSLVRILDIGGMFWESDERYQTVDQALAAAEATLAG